VQDNLDEFFVSGHRGEDNANMINYEVQASPRARKRDKKYQHKQLKSNSNVQPTNLRRVSPAAKANAKADANSSESYSDGDGSGGVSYSSSEDDSGSESWSSSDSGPQQPPQSKRRLQNLKQPVGGRTTRRDN